MNTLIFAAGCLVGCVSIITILVVAFITSQSPCDCERHKWNKEPR